MWAVRGNEWTKSSRRQTRIYTDGRVLSLTDSSYYLYILTVTLSREGELYMRAVITTIMTRRKQRCKTAQLLHTRDNQPSEVYIAYLYRRVLLRNGKQTYKSRDDISFDFESSTTNAYSIAQKILIILLYYHNLVCIRSTYLVGAVNWSVCV